MGTDRDLLTLITSDLAKSTGRFNLLQGAVQSAMGLCGFIGNLFFGWIAKAVSFNASFIGLAALAAAGGVMWQATRSETKPKEQSEQTGELQHTY